MCVNIANISHFDPGYAIIESEYVFVILKREMSLFSSFRRCTYTISDWQCGFWVLGFSYPYRDTHTFVLHEFIHSGESHSVDSVLSLVTGQHSAHHSGSCAGERAEEPKKGQVGQEALSPDRLWRSPWCAAQLRVGVGCRG
jgi:hypothetical protein